MRRQRTAAESHAQVCVCRAAQFAAHTFRHRTRGNERLHTRTLAPFTGNAHLEEPGVLVVGHYHCLGSCLLQRERM
jgi:hypothetical protein